MCWVSLQILKLNFLPPPAPFSTASSIEENDYYCFWLFWAQTMLSNAYRRTWLMSINQFRDYSKTACTLCWGLRMIPLCPHNSAKHNRKLLVIFCPQSHCVKTRRLQSALWYPEIFYYLHLVSLRTEFYEVWDHSEGYPLKCDCFLSLWGFLFGDVSYSSFGW